MGRALIALSILSLAACIDVSVKGGSTGAGSTGSTTGGSHSFSLDAGCPFCLPGPYAGVCESACPSGASPVSNQAGQATVDCAFAPSTACSLGLAECGGGNFPCLSDDAANCGACGHQCPTGARCLYGTCAELCGGGLVYLESDSANCGACGNVCAQGEVCGKGVCGAPCGATPASCTDTLQFKYPDGGVSCPTCDGCTLGFTPEPTCVDLSSDSNHCGTCGNICPEGDICTLGLCVAPCQAGEVCGNGSCQAQCPADFTSCPSASGPSQCYDLRNDPKHCGGCATSCPSCVDGVCAGACEYYGPDAG